MTIRLHLRQQHFLLLEKIVCPNLEKLLFVLDRPPLRDVLEAQQNERMAVIRTQHLAGVQQENARSDAGKFLRHQKSFHHRLVHQRTLQQVVQRRNVPGAIVQREQRLVGCILGIDLEGFVKGRTGDQNRQCVIENQQRFAHRLNDNLRERTSIFDPVEEHCHGHIVLCGPMLGLLRCDSKRGRFAGRQKRKSQNRQ